MTHFLFICATFLCVEYILCAPSLVLTTTPATNSDKENQLANFTKPNQLIIYEFDIQSNISNRFAKTLVTSKVKNAESEAKEATFTVVLPEKAFISEFIMEINGKSYKAYVKEKEEAKNIYDKARSSGQSAGHVAVSARDSNKFTVSVNVEPETKAIFLLTYEELLERRNDEYEHVLNIHPGQIIKDMNIEVQINESRPLKFVKTPSIRSGNEINKNDDSLNPLTNIQIINSTSALIKFKPDVAEQRKFIKGLGGKENEGLAGQLIVNYDVERDPHGGEVLLQDGYFVHYFAPDTLSPLAKHVVFVLDTSGSMFGTKLKQMKEAMISILDELKESDVFHIIEFNSYIYVWNIESGNRTQVDITNDEKPFEDLLKTDLPAAIKANKESIIKGKAVIRKLEEDGLTNMMSSISTALYVIKTNSKNEIENKNGHQPIIVFLTDGDPTMGIMDSKEIINITSQLNSGEHKIPIFSLSFGDGADKSFLRKFSLNNLGFSRHIYEAADACLQLQEFYQQISSPLLANVHFKYNSEVKDVSKIDFPIFFRGSELVVAGKYSGDLICEIDGIGENGTLTLTPTKETPVSSLERLWAYLTIKQKLEQMDTVENKTQLTEEALELALKYSFVTDVSSLVVVKPNDTNTVNTQDASKISEDVGSYAISLRFSDPSDGYEDLEMEETQDLPDAANVLTISNMSYVDWKDELPWLKYELNINKTLNISGRFYELDEKLFLQPMDNCSKTPNNTAPGKCTLLMMCPEVFRQLSTFQIYQEYFCAVQNRYAGVCCPFEVPEP